MAPLGASRIQITNSTGDRMLQIQQNRFHYNWRRKGDAYPSYSKMRGEFDAHFRAFAHFIKQTGLADIIPAQWELTYVDYVPPGELWETPEDIHRVVPGLLGTGSCHAELPLETVSGDWRYEITPRRGRLYINLSLGKTAGYDTSGILIQMTARGPVIGDPWTSLYEGMDVGHAFLIRKFIEVTSPGAHRVWGRKE